MTPARSFPGRHRETVRRPTDVGKVLARGLLVRTLRHAGLHHVLHGQPCAVGLAVAHDEDREVFVEVGKALLRDLTRHPFEYEFDLLDPDFDVIPIEGGGIKWSAKTTNLVRDRLVSRSRLFAFAPTPDDFPPLFRAAADAIIVPGPVSRHALKGAVQAVLGHAPPDDLLAAADGVPLATLGTIIRPGRNLHRTVRMLRALQAGDPNETAKGQDGPTLDDLHGLGAAAEWGRSLARDLADYRAGRIPWSDVDPGILLSGPPGTGKTIFARALASTCLVPIHVHSLARWQARGYLNDLLKAMRGAFDAAKRDAPCILFLDELDAFGDREQLEGKNEQYTREVINAFLECLDGSDGREGVVVVGATNMPGKVDAAILRPGRLDRHVVIPLPDLEARKGILRHHLREVLPGADLTEAAERLEGASGAVIEQVVRDARRRARTDRREPVPDDLLAALPRRVRLSDESFRRACVHEAGHAVVGFLLADEAGRIPVEVRVFREVSAESAAGHTAYRRLIGTVRTRAGYLAEITGLLAGLAAEELVFGWRSDGGGGSDGSDLQHATAIATAMEVSLGLGDGLTYLSPNDDTELIGRLRADPLLRRTVNRTLEESLARARSMLLANRPALDGIAGLLERNGRASLEEFRGIVTGTGRGPG